MENTITIKGQDYTVKTGMKAIIIFERMRDKPFEVKTTTDLLSYIYSAILASNPDTTLSFEDLIEAIDDDPKLMTQMSDMLLQRSSMSNLVAASKEGGTEPKKD